MVCGNIGPGQRRIRIRLAVAAFVLAGIAAVALFATAAPRLMRASLFAPLFVGALGFFQAQAHTCVALAARGQRNLDAGNEAVTDAGEAAASKARARSVVIRAVTMAAAVTAVLLVI
jgi:hypothetical protein